MPYATRIALLIAVALGCTECLFSQERLAFDVNSGVVHGSMMDIRDKRRVLLLTSKSYVVDSRGSARSVLNEIYQNPASARPRHSPAYNIIGRQLNKYIRKYQSLSAVEHLANADFVIVFKVVRDLRFFIEGEMFVIKNPTREDPRPRIVWQTKNDKASPEGAIKAFIKALKITRGEK